MCYCIAMCSVGSGTFFLCFLSFRRTVERDWRYHSPFPGDADQASRIEISDICTYLHGSRAHSSVVRVQISIKRK